MTNDTQKGGSIENRAIDNNWMVRHGVTLFLMFIPAFIAYGQITEKIATLVKDESEISKEVKILQADLNKQAVTIGKVVTTTNNIEKQLEMQQRVLERISEKIMGGK